MIFNCLHCGISISTQKENCPHCRADNFDAIQNLMGKAKKDERQVWKDRLKGSILSFVTR